MSRFARLPGLALLAVLLAGCTSSGGASTGQPSASVSAPSATESALAGATASVKPTKSTATPRTTPKTSPTPKLPSGFTLVSVKSKGFSIGVPKAWVQLNAGEIASLKDTLDELKKSNPEQAKVFEQAVTAIENGQIAMMAMDAKGAASGFATNVNVIVQDHVSASSREAVSKAVIPQLKSSLGVSEDAIEVTETDVAAGPALQIDFAYSMSGTDIRARQYHVFGPNHFFIVTFTSGGAFDKNATVFEQIIATLQDL